MKKLSAYVLVCVWWGATAAAAAPCVGTAFDQPFPKATDVVMKHLDLPSAQFPGLWQEGNIEGWPYWLFANSEGTIRSDRKIPAWQIAFRCEPDAKECNQSVKGVPPQKAYEIAANLENCLLGKTPDTDVVPITPEAETVIEPEPDARCESPLEESDEGGLALQKLLLLAGADPGPLDGIVGPLTQQALTSVLDESGQDRSLAEAIEQLEAFLCQTTD